MATTTNFGWDTPDDTDLVKDGAAAMRTLGNSIDTSFVDLKGGTTNQVLAKNSNTDLDFKWVADATGIPATIIDAKGDLIAGTAADTAARLAVGTNGYVLTADSVETTGLKWAAIPAASSKGCAVYNSADINISNATTTDVTWNTEIWDTDAFHSTSTNTARMTIPSGLGGYYLIQTRAAFAPNATGKREITVIENGTDYYFIADRTGVTGYNNYLSGTMILNLAAGDYITMSVYQNSGGTLALKSDNSYGGLYYSYFQIQFLGA